MSTGSGSGNSFTPPSESYGVPLAPVVASAGGSQGYGAPPASQPSAGYGPSSAVSPFDGAAPAPAPAGQQVQVYRIE